MKSDDVARFLADHPDFFERHPDLLDRLTVPHPQSGQAISLVERQSLILRGRIGALEARLADLIRHGEENDLIADRLVQWARAMLQERDPERLPDTALAALLRIFSVPDGAIRIWEAAPAYASQPWAAPVSDDVRRLVDSMQAPFCGSNVGFEAAAWMRDEHGTIQSLAMLPLRIEGASLAFGLLVLGSPDKDRFQITMGTAFLARIAELASAALARLRA